MAQLTSQWPKRRVKPQRVGAPKHQPMRMVLPPPDLTGTPCYWCGLATDDRKGTDTPHMLTRDHLVPRKRVTDASKIAVLVPACKHCNNRRGHEQDGKWVPFPHWRDRPHVLPPSQRDALRRRGLSPMTI